MAKRGKGCKSHPKGTEWQEDYYSRHESLEAKLQNTKVMDKSRAEHQKSTPPASGDIPTVVNAYENRRRTGAPGSSTAVIE